MDTPLRLIDSEGQPAELAPVPSVDEFPGYDFGRALESLALGARGHPGARDVAGFEWEVSDHLADHYQRDARGLVLPGGSKRAPPMDSSGALGAVNQIAVPGIQTLAPNSFMVQAGMRVLDGLTTAVTFGAPATATPEAVDEDADATEVELVPTARSLTPYSFAVHVPVTRRLDLQSRPALATYIGDAVSEAFGALWDRVALIGDATHGIEGAVGTAVEVSMPGGQPSDWNDLNTWIKGQWDLAGHGRRASWVLGKDGYSWAVGAGNDPATSFLQAHAGGSVTMGPYQVWGLQGPGTDAVYLLGRWQYLILGLFGPMELTAQIDVTRAAAGGIVYSAWQEGDVAPTSVCWTKPAT